MVIAVVTTSETHEELHAGRWRSEIRRIKHLFIFQIGALRNLFGKRHGIERQKLCHVAKHLILHVENGQLCFNIHLQPLQLLDLVPRRINAVGGPVQRMVGDGGAE